MADGIISLDWYLDEFGKKTIGYLLIMVWLKQIWMDFVDYIIEEDGREVIRAGWDGVEIEQDDFYIYKAG